MDGYEVLLQYDWCGVPMTGANLRPVAPANPQTACSGAPPASSPSPSPLRRRRAPRPCAGASPRCGSPASSTRCAPARWRCARAAPARRSAAAAKRYGKAAYNIPPGNEATVRVALSKAGRKALKRKRRLAVDAVVTAAGSSWTLPLKLKRKR